MTQHHRQHWSHSDTSHEEIAGSGFILFWIAFLLFDAVLWVLIYRLGEWAWQWV